jgi:integrase
MARKPTGQVISREGVNGRRFAIRFRAHGQRHYVTTSATTREEAEIELANVLADVRRGKWQPPIAEREEPEETPTFWTLATRWYEQKELEVDKRTREHWRYLLNSHLVWFGSLRVDEIIEAKIDEYRAKKVADGTLSASTINKTLRLLARILDRAVKHGYLERNPARGDDSRLKEPTPRRIWLELDEVRSLLDAAGDYRGELSTLILAGLRISELGGLRWRAVDLASGTLTVEESKTEAGEGRVIDLTPSLLSELKLHKAKRSNAAPDDLVFPTSKGRARDRGNSRGRLRTILKRANAKRAEQGLAPIAALTNHTCRRTFASLMYEAGAQPTDVMGQLGHKSSKLALEVYARRMKRDRDTGKRIDALVQWAQMGTNDDSDSEALAQEETEIAVEQV